MNEEKFIHTYRNVAGCAVGQAQSALIIWDAKHPDEDEEDSRTLRTANSSNVPTRSLAATRPEN